METPNPLARYLSERGETCAAFARSIGAHPTQISRIVAGRRGPSVPLAFAIDRATAGAVPASTWSEHRRNTKPAHGRKRPAITRRRAS